MAITADMVNLNTFLDKCTYQRDANPGNKLVLSDEAFFKCLCLLKLDASIQGLNLR